MLEDFFSPFVTWGLFGALFVEPLHIVLRIQMNGDGEVPYLNRAAAHRCRVFWLAASDKGGCGKQRFVTYQEHLAETNAWAMRRHEVDAGTVHAIDSLYET